MSTFSWRVIFQNLNLSQDQWLRLGLPFQNGKSHKWSGDNKWVNFGLFWQEMSSKSDCHWKEKRFDVGRTIRPSSDDQIQVPGSHFCMEKFIIWSFGAFSFQVKLEVKNKSNSFERTKNSSWREKRKERIQVSVGCKWASHWPDLDTFGARQRRRAQHGEMSGPARRRPSLKTGKKTKSLLRSPEIILRLSNNRILHESIYGLPEARKIATKS